MDPALFSALPTHHVQIIGASGELAEGNSIFVSFSFDDEPDRAPAGLCAVTISTHTRPEQWFKAKEKGSDAYLELKRAFTEHLLDVLSEQFPQARDAVRSITAATPVTWERYTGRFQGLVGGYPQTSLFKVRGPATLFDNLFLVGDSVFPGQSLPGVVTGARRAIELLLQRNEKTGRTQQ
jgi:phytoene dehydrogenase-like protein